MSDMDDRDLFADEVGGDWPSGQPNVYTFFADDQEEEDPNIDELGGLIIDDDEEDFLVGVTCNPDAPEECESCQ